MNHVVNQRFIYLKEMSRFKGFNVFKKRKLVSDESSEDDGYLPDLIERKEVSEPAAIVTPARTPATSCGTPRSNTGTC